MAISLHDLKLHMRFHMASLTMAFDTWRDISENTAHSEMFPIGGVGTAKPPRIYKSLVRFSITQDGGDDKNWPDNWQSLTIAELAPKLL